MDWAKHGVKIVHSDELDLNTPQTSGMTRREAISGKTTGSEKVWMGQTHVAPGTRSAAHHHFRPGQ